MAVPWKGRDQRRSPRVDVLMRVEGELVEVKTPIVVHDMSMTGFAVISEVAFPAGETLDFRLVADGEVVSVTAESVHTLPARDASGLHLSGFKFIPGRLTGLVPRVKIERLISAVNGPAVSCF
jgi:hypothetical protein